MAAPKSLGKGGLALITGIRFGGVVGLVSGDPGLGSLGVAIFGANGCGLFDGLTPMGLMTIGFDGDLTGLGALDRLTIVGTIAVGIGVGITGWDG